jgi:23S rRNA (adenine2503-C2)-methyltransferase
VSTQCGCPVGCTFCGTGQQFVRSLEEYEITEQVDYIFNDIGMIDNDQLITAYSRQPINKVKKLQIMFMSMGEPMLNWYNMDSALATLHSHYPTADLLISTIGPKIDDNFACLIHTSAFNDKIGLQFSIHKAFDHERDELIPFKGKMDLKEIRDYGVEWYAVTGRQVYLNYCVDGKNNRMKDFWELSKLFPRNAFAFTFSVVCSADETMKDAGYRQMKEIELFQSYFVDDGYNCRIFDPAGQDTIGGGCGQLWYVQDWMKKRKE